MENNEFVKDENLIHILEDKKIALVGPSPHLIGTGLAEEINKYDIVCRVNEAIPLNFFEDYGDRVDIIFHNCSTRSVCELEFLFKRYGEYLKEKLLMFICPVIKAHHGDEGSVVDNFNKVNIYNLPFYSIGHYNYNIINNRVGVEPNTGIMSISFLLSYNIGELFVTGMSFYRQGNTYDECYYKGHITDQFRYSDFNAGSGHSLDPQVKYFKNFILDGYGKKVKIDSYLNNIFNFKHSNVHELIFKKK